MSCRTVHQILEQARDERLPPLVQSALDAHLSTCPDCARLGVLESRLASGLAALRQEDAELELPPDFRRRVKERLLASDRRRPDVPAGGWAWGWPAGLAAAAACLAVAVLASLALQKGSAPAGGAIAAVEPAPATGLVPVKAEPQTEPPVDLRTAPLLYATPEVEVLYGGRATSPLRTVGDVESPEEAVDETTSRPREYHF